MSIIMRVKATHQSLSAIQLLAGTVIATLTTWWLFTKDTVSASTPFSLLGAT